MTIRAMINSNYHWEGKRQGDSDGGNAAEVEVCENRKDGHKYEKNSHTVCVFYFITIGL